MSEAAQSGAHEAGEPVPTSRRGAIVLCGGSSRRMGRDKASLPFGGASLLAQTVCLIRPCVAQVVVVARSTAQQLPEDVKKLGIAIACDRRPGNGPLEAVAAGWAALPTDTAAALVCGCDTPLVRSALVERLFRRVTGFDAVVPMVGERVHPLLAVYARQSRPFVHQCLQQDKRSMRDLLQRIRVCWLKEHELREVDRELESFVNVNDEASYQRALRLVGL